MQITAGHDRRERIVHPWMRAKEYGHSITGMVGLARRDLSMILIGPVPAVQADSGSGATGWVPVWPVSGVPTL